MVQLYTNSNRKERPKLRFATSAKKKKKGRSIFDKAIDLLDVPDALVRSGVQYGLEAIGGKDWYKEGDFKRALKGQRAASFSESYERISGESNTKTLLKGLAMDIAFSPTTWLSLGLSWFTKGGKAIKAAKAVGKLQKTANISKKASDAKKALRAAENLQKLTTVKDITKLKKLGKAVNIYDKTLAGAVIGKGVNDFADAETTEERLRGVFAVALGSLGLSGSVFNKNILKQLERTKNPQQLAEKLGDLIASGKLTNDLQKVVGHESGESGAFKVDTNDLARMFRKKGLDIRKGTDDSSALATLIDSNVSDGSRIDIALTKSGKKLTKKDNDEVLAAVQNMQEKYSTAVRKRLGKSIYQDTNYLQAEVKVKEIDPKTGEFNIRPADEEELLKLSQPKNKVQAIKGMARYDDIKRKYKTDAERNTHFQELFDKGETDVLFVSNPDFYERFEKQMSRASSLLKKVSYADGFEKYAHKLEDGGDIVRIFDNKAVSKQLKDAARTKSEDIKVILKDKTGSVKGLEQEYTDGIDAILNNPFRKSDEGSITDVLSELDVLDKTHNEKLGFLLRGYGSDITKQDAVADVLRTYNKSRQGVLNDIAGKMSRAKKLGYEHAASREFPGIVGYGVKPDIKDAMRNIGDVSQSKAKDSLVGFEAVMQTIKRKIVTGDLFQHVQVARKRISVGRKQFMKGLLKNKSIEEQGKLTKKWQSFNMQVGQTYDADVASKRKGLLEPGKRNKIVELLDDAEDAITDKKLLRPYKVFRDGTEAIEHNAFNVVTKNAKNEMAEVIQKRLIKKGVGETEAGFQTAQFINNQFAGQNWDSIMAANPSLSKSVLQLSRLMIFAPDYFMSRINSTLGLTARGAIGGEYRKEFMASMLTGITLLQVLQYSITGHSTLENREGNEFKLEIPKFKDEKGKPIAIDILGNWGETLRSIDNPNRYLSGKAGIAAKLYTGSQGPYGVNVESLIPVPIALKDYIKYYTDEGSQVPETQGGALLGAGLQAGGFNTSFGTANAKPSALRSLLKDVDYGK